MLAEGRILWYESSMVDVHHEHIVECAARQARSVRVPTIVLMLVTSELQFALEAAGAWRVGDRLHNKYRWRMRLADPGERRSRGPSADFTDIYSRRR